MSRLNKEARFMDELYELDKNEKVDLINFCKRYPSGDNCQPFKFNFKGHVLEIIHVPTRGEHNLNPHSIASLISLGTIEYYLESWLKEKSLKLIKSYEFIDNQLGIFNSSYSFKKRDTSITSLPCPDLRVSNRSQYTKSQEPFEFDEIFSILDIRFPDIGCYLVPTPLKNKLMKYLQLAESYMWKDEKTIHDFLKWLKFKFPCPEGLYWKNLGIDVFAAIGLFSMKHITFTRKILKYIVQIQSKLIVKRLINSSDGIVILSTKNNSPETLINIGFCLSHIWCALGAANKAVQAHNLGFLPLQASISLKHKTSIKYDNILKEGHDLISKELNFSKNEVASWMFRYGECAPLNENAKVGRLSNSEISNLTI
jgi:hypothetical protein